MDFDFGKNLKRICNEQGTSPTKVVVELGYSNSKVNMLKKRGYTHYKK